MKFIAILLLFVSTSSFATEDEWIDLFKSTFYSESIYEERQCTHNVLRYLRQARSQGLNVNQIQVIELLNKGFSNFGMVGAQNSRGVSERDHTSNWYHHVFLKLGDLILDYDYTMKPTPTSIQKYFKSMYLTEYSRKSQDNCIKDLGRYEITIYSGKDYLRYYDDKVLSDHIPKKRFLLQDTNWACE